MPNFVRLDFINEIPSKFLNRENWVNSPGFIGITLWTAKLDNLVLYFTINV